jgi:hypothetical protein
MFDLNHMSSYPFKISCLIQSMRGAGSVVGERGILVIPLTTSLKSGTWYSKSNVKGVEGRYCLNQIRMIDAKRLKYRIERIDQNDFEKLKSDFNRFINF